MKISFDELKELVFEYLSEVASVEYVKSANDDDVDNKSWMWLNYVITTATSGSGFTDWLEPVSEILTPSDLLRMIEYISDYHDQRDLDNGSMLAKSVPTWVNKYLDRQIVIQKGHTEMSIIGLFAEALCYLEMEEAYTHILFVVNQHMALKSFTERVGIESANDPRFKKWVDNHLYHHTKSLPNRPPSALTRQIACGYNYFEQCVKEDVTWDMFYGKFVEDMKTRDRRLVDVTKIIRAAGLESIFDPEHCVDESGWDKEYAESFVEVHQNFVEVREPLPPRRSSRIARKRKRDDV